MAPMRSPAREGDLHEQLAAIAADLERAQTRLHRVADTIPAEQWSRRPDPSAWSVGECVAHLNLTGRAYVPLLHDALARARALGESAPVRYRRDPIGWVIGLASGPLPRIGRFRFGRVRTTPPFVPSGDLPKLETLAEFDRLQVEQISLTRAADGLPLGRVRIVSPFDARLSYNAYACLVILPRHQHRHIEQAEGVRSRLVGG